MGEAYAIRHHREPILTGRTASATLLPLWLVVIRGVTLTVVIEVGFAVKGRVPVLVSIRTVFRRLYLDRILSKSGETLGRAHSSHIILLISLGRPIEPNERDEPALVLHELGEEFKNIVTFIGDFSR